MVVFLSFCDTIFIPSDCFNEFAEMQPSSLKSRHFLHLTHLLLSILTIGTTDNAPVGHSTSHSSQWTQYVVLFKIRRRWLIKNGLLPTLNASTRIVLFASSNVKRNEAISFLYLICPL